MIQTLNTSQAAHLLVSDEYAGWTYSGAHALVEYLEDLEEQLGTPMEFDTVAIRCDYSEYKHAVEYADQFAEFTDEIVEGETSEENEARALEFLQERTQVIEFEGGIIVMSF